MKTEQIAQERIDAALDLVLKASGTFRHYRTRAVIESMRRVMRKIMSDAYIQGSNDCAKAMAKERVQ